MKFQLYVHIERNEGKSPKGVKLVKIAKKHSKIPDLVAKLQDKVRVCRQEVVEIPYELAKKSVLFEDNTRADIYISSDFFETFLRDWEVVKHFHEYQLQESFKQDSLITLWKALRFFTFADFQKSHIIAKWD